MGIPNIFRYLKKNKLAKKASIRNELRLWKRHHGDEDKQPIIVIDVKNLMYSLARNMNSFHCICGGRHQKILRSWENVLVQFKERLCYYLKDTECKFVFFCDLILTADKTEKWMERETEEFEKCVQFYETIDGRLEVQQIVDTKNMLDMKPSHSIFYDMEIIARKYGDFHYSVNRENDLELARYAKANDVFAVISNDFDFLIFEGLWNHWSSNEIVQGTSKVQKYFRNHLPTFLNLTREQMPLFATVWGNDYVNEEFFKTIDETADFVRNKSALPVKEIVEALPKQHIDVEVFQNSLNAYDTDFVDDPIDDPFEQLLLNKDHKMYRFYKFLMAPIHAISLPFYDMKENEPTANLPELIIKWTQRKIGILHDHKRRNDDPHTFCVIAKKTRDEPFSCFENTPDYPNDEDFSLPDLSQLYLENEFVSADLIEVKWNILQWIMSFTDSEILTIRNVDERFRLICAILCALVKENLLSVMEADGILFAESVEISDEIRAIRPNSPDPHCVRAAHKYNIVFSYVRENFLIAGLSSYIQETMTFDGLYFQKLMTTFVEYTNDERNDRMRPIKNSVMTSGEFDLF